MSTLRQIEANRRNALRSTGPTSVAGKAVSSMNALQTGLHAKSLLLPSEKLADLQQLIDEYYQSHHPATPEARCLLDDLIRCEWTLRRLDHAEAQMWVYQNDDMFGDPEKYPLGHSTTSYASSFSKLQYRLDATRRARDRALCALQKLQAETAPAPAPASVVEPEDLPSLIPLPQTASPQIGFVPPTPADTPPQAAPTASSPAPGRPVPVGAGHAQISMSRTCAAGLLPCGGPGGALQ